MELRLQQFIESVEQLADIRNLDVFNPIIFQLEHPVTAIRYTIAGSKAEPSYLGLPVNTTWIVLDPTSAYYRMALKLVDTNNPDASTLLAPIDLKTDVNKDGVIDSKDLLYWNIIRTYDEIFSIPQYYVGAATGPRGPQGPAGTNGVVDYNRALGILTGLTGTLSITGPTSVQENSVQQYTITLVESEVLADGTILPPAPVTVTAPITLVGNVPAGTYVDGNNVLHAGEIPADTVISLYTTYPSWAKNVVANLNVTLLNTAAAVSSVALVGQATANSGDAVQYSVDVTWSDGTVTHPSAVWSLNSPNFGTISSSGLLTIPVDIVSSGSVNVAASFSLNTTVYNPNKTVVVTKTVDRKSVV